MSTYKEREAKRFWAYLNRARLRENNRQYRARHRERSNKDSAERMRRYRAKRRQQKRGW